MSRYPPVLSSTQRDSSTPTSHNIVFLITRKKKRRIILRNTVFFNDFTNILPFLISPLSLPSPADKQSSHWRKTSEKRINRVWKKKKNKATEKRLKPVLLSFSSLPITDTGFPSQTHHPRQVTTRPPIPAPSAVCPPNPTGLPAPSRISPDPSSHADATSLRHRQSNKITSQPDQLSFVFLSASTTNSTSRPPLVYFPPNRRHHLSFSSVLRRCLSLPLLGPPLSTQGALLLLDACQTSGFCACAWLCCSIAPLDAD